ncbi:O-glucosyltransferase rumi [Carex littledalei]|uniref:O-glucosyltransferase rumi n=1 Tax=Carex littledalei TaxID=544730 RepID=A0A833VWE8_9POAL|nr:O-glucosyltransferase rumi [Carex littledalei]
MLKVFALKLNKQICAKAGVVTFTCFLLILLLTSRWNHWNDDFLCPEFFRYIDEDLKPWKYTGISKEMVESAKHFANFRLVISDGRVYMKRYKRSFQTRDIFTLWGIVQLLNRYPGRVPDLDLMFECADLPLVKASDYSSTPAPLLFRYCKDNTTLDIVFPDWAFWGCEKKVNTWKLLHEFIKARDEYKAMESTIGGDQNGEEKFNWTNRQPYAYWKGHAGQYANRKDLLSCNVSNDHEWNARIFNMNWHDAVAGGFKDTDLAKQCTYRYKIYVEGNTWSVSDKYILACDSPVLFVKSRYVGFFTRGLIPGRHYWPIRTDRKCKSIKFSVDWGNKHEKEELRMENVYQYMLHLLTEYAKLLHYKPVIPKGAKGLCLESMVYGKTGCTKAFMLESMENFVYDSEPCNLPPPFESSELQEIASRNEKFAKQVERMEDELKE